MGETPYPKRYKKKEIKRAIKTIKLFNFLVRDDITLAQVDSAISTIRHNAVILRIDTNGPIQTIDLEVTGSYRYLSSRLKKAYMDGYCIATRIELEPRNHIYSRGISYRCIDLKISSNIYAKYIDYPITLTSLMSGYADLMFEKFNIDNLIKVSAAHPVYRRFTDRLTDGVKDSIDNLFLSQFDPNCQWRYSVLKADPSIRGLVDGGHYAIVRDLVFSPNYNVAIEAMEGIIYLCRTGKLVMDDELDTRIKELKADTGRILLGGGCVRTTLYGYESLNVPFEAILHKFRDPVQSNSLWFY